MVNLLGESSLLPNMLGQQSWYFMMVNLLVSMTKGGYSSSILTLTTSHNYYFYFFWVRATSHYLLILRYSCDFMLHQYKSAFSKSVGPNKRCCTYVYCMPNFRKTATFLLVQKGIIKEKRLSQNLTWQKHNWRSFYLKRAVEGEVNLYKGPSFYLYSFFHLSKEKVLCLPL